MKVLPFPKPEIDKFRVVHTNSELQERLSMQPYMSQGKMFVNIKAENSDSSTCVIAVRVDKLIAELAPLVNMVYK